MPELPDYPENEPVSLRLARCIQHELDHGGNAFAAAQAILRDIRLGYIVIPETE